MELDAAAHVFVDDLDALDLGDDDRHHLDRVLRLRPGQVVTASDGAGGWRRCEWTAAGLAATGDVQHDERPLPAITIGFAVPKADRPEWIVLAQPGGGPPALTHGTVLVGPEGGWTHEECAGRVLVDLGPTMLRTETAALTAGILLTALRAGNVSGTS